MDREVPSKFDDGRWADSLVWQLQWSKEEDDDEDDDDGKMRGL